MGRISRAEFDRLRQHERREKGREFTRKHMEHHPCVRCGETDWRVLEFHHRDPREKKHSVGYMVNKGMSINQIREEMEKCDVMCSNCHRRHHHEERDMHNDVRRERVRREQQFRSPRRDKPRGARGRV